MMKNNYIELIAKNPINNKILTKIENFQIENNNFLIMGNIGFYTFDDFINMYELYNNDDYTDLKMVFKNYNMNNENTFILGNGLGDDYYILINTQYGLLININVDLDFNIYHFKNDYFDYFPHDIKQLSHEKYIICLLLDFIINIFTDDNFTKNDYQIKPIEQFNDNDFKNAMLQRFEKNGIFVDRDNF